MKMSFLALNYHLSGLLAANCALIKIYKNLYKVNLQEEGLKEEIGERMALRENFHKELAQCIENNITKPNKAFLDRILIITISLIAKTGMSVYFLSISPTWENCNDCERENLKLYYKILYIPELPKEVTDMLLEQKGQVEGYLIGNAY